MMQTIIQEYLISLGYFIHPCTVSTEVTFEIYTHFVADEDRIDTDCLAALTVYDEGTVLLFSNLKHPNHIRKVLESEPNIFQLYACDWRLADPELFTKLAAGLEEIKSEWIKSSGS